ncbi:MAG: hypothetical protein Q8R28_02120 [Dehalococcoidia bacterium]|nr:hypothetical protein [Dehalococcoidia bacterium]
MLHLDGAGHPAAAACVGEEVDSPDYQAIENHMGIDIYARWKDQTQEEANRIDWFSVEDGHVGYLREAYHGEPYATRHLVAEAFASDRGEARIPAAVLRKRLPETIRLAKERQRVVYKRTVADDDPVIKSFTDFVELCERKERETGAPVTITASY